MRLLVIDPSRAMRQMLVGALDQLGHRDVSEVATSEDGLQQLAAGRFDAVLTDWVMPGLSGPEFVKAMRALDAARDTPVVVVTAHATREQVLAAIGAGVNAYIVKPFTVDTLRQKIEAIARAHAASEV